MEETILGSPTAGETEMVVEEGRQAFHDNVPYDKNPYASGSILNHAWSCGWLEESKVK